MINFEGKLKEKGVDINFPRAYDSATGGGRGEPRNRRRAAHSQYHWRRYRGWFSAGRTDCRDEEADGILGAGWRPFHRRAAGRGGGLLVYRAVGYYDHPSRACEWGGVGRAAGV